jgi:hypothetical protein
MKAHTVATDRTNKASLESAKLPVTPSQRESRTTCPG